MYYKYLISLIIIVILSIPLTTIDAKSRSKVSKSNNSKMVKSSRSKSSISPKTRSRPSARPRISSKSSRSKPSVSRQAPIKKATSSRIVRHRVPNNRYNNTKSTTNKSIDRKKITKSLPYRPTNKGSMSLQKRVNPKPNIKVITPAPRSKRTATHSKSSIRTFSKPIFRPKMNTKNRTLLHRPSINKQKLNEVRKGKIENSSKSSLYSTRNRNTRNSHTSIVIRSTPAYRSLNHYGSHQKHFYHNNNHSRSRRYFCRHSSIGFHIGFSSWDSYPSTYWGYNHYYYDPYCSQNRYNYYNDYYPKTIYYEPLVVVTAPQIHLSRQEQLIKSLLFESAEKREDDAYELGDYRNISSIAALTDTMINDAEPAVRAASAYSLGKIENPMAYEGLMRCASAENDEQVRESAFNGAKHIKEINGSTFLIIREKYPPMNLGKDTLGERLELLRFGTEHQRRIASSQLCENKGTQTVAALINVAINDSDHRVRKEAIESLGKIGDIMAIPFLKYIEVNDNNRSVCREAKVAIARIH